MNPNVHQFLSIDLPPMLTAVFASLACGVLGNFLLLRRLSLMGDAISHSVLPGLVIAFLITGTRSPIAMFIGAAVAGVLTVAVVELIRRFARLESGAAMGVTFSIFFALGVLLLEQAAARQVDLDPDCVLHGMLETIFWFPPAEWASFGSFGTFADTPRQVIITGSMAIIAMLFVTLLFKELRIATFDPALATALGMNATTIHYALMVLVAASTVAAFEAVGSILVIAMLICPAATARLLTDRLRTQVVLSAFISVITAASGYVLGAFGPIWLGHHSSFSATGMMTAVAGAIFTLTVIFSPSHGVIVRQARRIRLAVSIAREDVLGLLYRFEEYKKGRATRSVLLNSLGRSIVHRLGLRAAFQHGEVARHGASLMLTDRGRRAAASVIRSHRLWETYLVEQAGLRPDHVHDTAMRLEHLATDTVRTGLAASEPETHTDPQGKPIPGYQPLGVSSRD
jgi:manganese/zinc/iron transport system permease protein